MPLWLTLFAFFFSTASLAVERSPFLHCEYSFRGFAVATLELPLLGGDVPADFVRVILQGKPHLESFTAEEAGEGQCLRGWISKGHPENEIEMIVYAEAQREGNSKIVNHHVPMGKEVWGRCERNERNEPNTPTVPLESLWAPNEATR